MINEKKVRIRHREPTSNKTIITAICKKTITNLLWDGGGSFFIRLAERINFQKFDLLTKINSNFKNSFFEQTIIGGPFFSNFLSS